MSDFQSTTSALLVFRNARDGEQFHNPKGLAIRGYGKGSNEEREEARAAAGRLIQNTYFRSFEAAPWMA